jgi:hypothetical protein
MLGMGYICPMIKLTQTALLVALISAPALANDTTGWREADYRDALCAGMDTEVHLGSYGRADCVSETHAIEVEWADKFKEGVGQALTYSQRTTLVAGLILVCRRSESSCLNHSLAAQEVLSAYGAEAMIWECGLSDVSLSTCVERHLPAAR